ncbi:MAG: hypothetical protein AMXMBFR59_34690 [Rhodanobacteraceae bacterium]
MLMKGHLWKVRDRLGGAAPRESPGPPDYVTSGWQGGRKDPRAPGDPVEPSQIHGRRRCVQPAKLASRRGRHKQAPAGRETPLRDDPAAVRRPRGSQAGLDAGKIGFSSHPRCS